jgi:alpha-L-arabinofuranosidase
VEVLEARCLLSNVTIDVGQPIRTVNSMILGANLGHWDTVLNTARTRQMVQDAGLSSFRFPGGSAADDNWHFDDWSYINSVADFGRFVNSVGGAGMITLNYGTGSPHEAAALLAYLNGQVGDTTSIGTGQQWGTTSWVNKNWRTADYWASLRAATPLASDDGLNFLRAGHAAPFGIHYFELGNEVFGDWEVDHHTPAHNATPYVTFAAQFAAYAAQIDPTISLGLSFLRWDESWDDAILQEVVNQNVPLGFVSDHDYFTDDVRMENDQQLLLHSMTDPDTSSWITWVNRSQYFRDKLGEYLGDAGADVELFMTEYNSISNNPSTQSTSLVNGLWLADSLGGLLETDYNGAQFWALRDGDEMNTPDPTVYGWRPNGDSALLGTGPASRAPYTGNYVPYPTYFAEQLVSKLAHDGDTVVLAYTNDQYLTAYAVAQQNGHLAVLVVNKSPTSSKTGNFQVTGFAPDLNATVWQYGEAEDTAQSQTTDGSASLSNFTVTLDGTANAFSATFPRYSMTVLDLAPAAPRAPAAAQGRQAFTLPPAPASLLPAANPGSWKPAATTPASWDGATAADSWLRGPTDPFAFIVAAEGNRTVPPVSGGPARAAKGPAEGSADAGPADALNVVAWA